MTNTHTTALNVQIIILKQQIELEESNYKYAVELNKDYDTLLTLQMNIIEQKKILYNLVKELAIQEQ